MKAAIIGTDTTGDDPRQLLLDAGVQGLRRLAGYTPKNLGYDWGTHYFVMGLDAPYCFRLENHSWIEIYLCFDEIRLRYANVHIFPDFAVLFWTHADEITYEYAGIMVTRDALIEIWSQERKVES